VFKGRYQFSLVACFKADKLPQILIQKTAKQKTGQVTGKMITEIFWLMLELFFIAFS
jgi:hypothetical protein